MFDRVIHYFVRSAAKILAVVFWRIRCFGIKNIRNKQGVLYVSNHQSYLDLLAVSACIPKSIYYMARVTLNNSLIFRLTTWPFPIIFIDREKANPHALIESIEKLKEGKSLLMFPEGTRTKSGKIGNLRMGCWKIARESGVLLVPVRIHGSYESWPKNKLLPSPGRVSVMFGRPVDAKNIEIETLRSYLENFWSMPYKDALNQLT